MLNKKLFALVFILLLANTFNVMFYVRNGYAFGGDQALYVPNLNNLYEAFFVWDTHFYSGYVTTSESTISLPFLLIDYVLFKLLGLRIESALPYLLNDLFESVGMFLLLYEFLKKDYSENVSLISAFAGAILISINYESHLQVLDTAMPFIPFSLLFLLLL